jgi:hypothetical protein
MFFNNPNPNWRFSMPVKRKKATASPEVQRADKALEILNPIFKKVGWKATQGFDLCFMSFKTSPVYISLDSHWSDAFQKTDPCPKSATYKQNGIFDRDSFRRDYEDWKTRQQSWFSGQLNAIQEELKSVCSKNGWRFRTAGTQLRINP